MFNKKHILVIDDDNRLSSLLKTYLFSKGYLVDSTPNTLKARVKLENILFDLIILDVMLPDESGLTFAKIIKHNNNIPILMLSAMGDAEDRIKGLKTGVDEYLPKPFEPEELLLRIENVLRRRAKIHSHANTINLGDSCLNISANLLTFIDKEIQLTSNEVKILLNLYKCAPISVKREDLAQTLEVSSRTIDVMIKRLRNKLIKIPNSRNLLLTVRGVGYKMNANIE